MSNIINFPQPEPNDPIASLRGKKDGEAEMMNKKPLFAVGAVLTMTLAVGGAVILAGHPNPVCAAAPESGLRRKRGNELQGRRFTDLQRPVHRLSSTRRRRLREEWP